MFEIDRSIPTDTSRIPVHEAVRLFGSPEDLTAMILPNKPNRTASVAADLWVSCQDARPTETDPNNAKQTQLAQGQPSLRSEKYEARNAKQTQFRLFWPKNAGPIEKQSQLGHRPKANCRAILFARLWVSCGDARPTKTDPENVKQSQSGEAT